MMRPTLQPESEPRSHRLRRWNSRRSRDASTVVSLVLVLCLGVVASAEKVPDAKQRQLLKTFRAEFIAIHPGQGKHPASFLMHGTPDGKKKQVTLTEKFSINKFEVTQNVWTSVMGSNPSKWKGERNSVEFLTFQEANDFCKKITALLRSAKLIDGSQEVRLPTEAEWEYVARAGTTTMYSFGDDVSLLDAHAWSTQNAAGNDPPVGALQPNPWGLYDVHGYLWEWCTQSTRTSDDSGSSTTQQGTPNKRNVDSKAKPKQVLRGGSWKDAAEKLTSSYRFLAPADSRDDAVGLRCVLANVKTKTKQH